MSKRRLNPIFRHKLEQLGKCVCGKQIFASMAAVIHEVPYCKAFLDMEPVAFLSYVRRFRGISDARAYPEKN